MSENQEAQAGQETEASELQAAITEAQAHPHVPTCVSEALRLLALATKPTTQEG